MIFYGILLVIFSTIFGQFLRIEVGSGGILFSDIFLPILILVWFLQKIYTKGAHGFYRDIKKFPLFWESFFVITIFSASLFLGGEHLSMFSFFESGFYLFRYVCLILFSLVVFDVFSEKKEGEKRKKIFLFTLFFSGFCLAILGFLQLYFYPDFKEMAKVGWDPHIGRLLSTWFDPNYLGGLFSFLLVLLAGIFSLFLPKRWKNIGEILPSLSRQQLIFLLFFFAVTGVFLLSLVFTFSRSALLAFVVPVFFLGVLYFRKIFLLSTLAVLFLLPFSERAMERIGDGIQSAVSVTEKSPLFLPDPTARLRVENFEEGLLLLKENFWTGIGFNTIRLHRVENINSSGGFDSSFLTVFVTTGVFGFLAFLWWHFRAAILLLKKTNISSPKYSFREIQKGIQRGLLFSFLGIFAQSFFVNILFFPLFLLYVFGVLGCCLVKK